MPDSNAAPTLSRRRFTVGDYTVDATARELIGPDKRLLLTPRTMDVLVHLAQQAGHAVTNEELLAAYWRGPLSSVNAVHKCMTELRHAFDDDREHPRYFETIPRRGYRLIATVAAASDEPGNGGTLRGTALLANSDAPAAPTQVAEVDVPGHAAPRQWPMPAVMATLIGAALMAGVAVHHSGWLVPAQTSASTRMAPVDPATSSMAAPPLAGPLPADDAAPASTATAADTGDRPTLAVLRISATGPGSASLATALRQGLVQPPDRLANWFSETPTEASSQYALDSGPAGETGRALRAQYVLGGDVKHDASGFRVRMHLHRTSDGAELYSVERVSAKATPAFMDSVVNHMFAAVQVYTGAPEWLTLMRSISSTNPEAFLAANEGYEARAAGDPASIRRSLDAFERAIALEPGLLRIYRHYADQAALLARFTPEPDARRVLLEDLQELRRKMLQHNPAREDVAAFNMAESRLRADGYAQHEEAVVARLMALKPGEQCVRCYGDYMGILIAGRLYDEAERYRAAALLQEPGNPWLGMSVRSAIVRLRDGPHLAIAMQKEALKDFPTDISLMHGLIVTLAQVGQYEEAEDYLKQMVMLDREGLWAFSARTLLQALRGDLKPGSSALRALLADPRMVPLSEGTLHFTLGDVPAGVAAWRRMDAFAQQFLASTIAYTESTFPPAVLADARYQALLEDLDIGASWTRRLRQHVAALQAHTGIPPGPAATTSDISRATAGERALPR